MIYPQEQVNLHTHSFYCGHGKGQLSDFVESAQQNGSLKVLGFSEHCPTPFDCLPSRMPFSQFKTYISDVNKQKEESKSIKVLLGAECDWKASYYSFYKEEVLGKNRFDYLLGSVHFMIDPADGNLNFIGHIKDTTTLIKDYTKSYIEMLNSGLFICGCHPDLFASGLTQWTSDAKEASRDIIQAAKSLNMPLEINGQGLRKELAQPIGDRLFKYPVREFWEMAKAEGVKICFNFDAHIPENLALSKNGSDFIQSLNVKFVDWDISDNKIGAVTKVRISD